MLSRRFAGHDIDRCRRIARNLAESLQKLHSFGIIHCDVKPRNILFMHDEDVVDDNDDSDLRDRLVLCDLDVSAEKGSILNLADKMPSSAHSAPELQRWKVWASVPEHRRQEAVQVTASEQLDVWSFGTVLYELCCGQELFSRNFADDEIIDAADEMRK